VKLPKPDIIAIRAHDMHHGLSLKTGGLLSRVKTTRIVGACAQLSTVIKDQEVIENYSQLEAAAGEIGIDELLLERCLKDLEEVEFVRLKKSGDEITRIDVKVPLLDGIYGRLGELWVARKPSEFEQVGIGILDEVATMPQKATDIQERYGLSLNDMGALKDLGTAGSYLGTYTSRKDGEEVWYSPLHWDEKPEQMMRLADKYPSHGISEVFQTVRDYQGKPSDDLKDGLLTDAIALGCLPTCAVKSTAGKKQFVFTPIANVGLKEKSILTKARALLSCVRYGENFGSITRIKDPSVLLAALKVRGYLRPHTEILRQYETLRDLGVGRIARDSAHSDRYWFHLIDNAENKKALELAIQMLQIGDVAREVSGAEKARQLLLPGVFEHPTAVRAGHMTKERITLSLKTVEVVNDLIRGVSSDLISK
jgi:hypothetical protein